MVVINVFDEEKVDTSSIAFREKIADSVKDMVLRDWDKIVQLEEYQDEENFYVNIKIKLE